MVSVGLASWRIKPTVRIRQATTEASIFAKSYQRRYLRRESGCMLGNTRLAANRRLELAFAVFERYIKKGGSETAI